MKRDVSSPTECSRLHNASYSDLEAESESSFTSATSSIARIRSICANFAERYPERLSAQGFAYRGLQSKLLRGPLRDLLFLPEV